MTRTRHLARAAGVWALLGLHAASGVTPDTTSLQVTPSCEHVSIGITGMVFRDAGGRLQVTDALRCGSVTLRRSAWTTLHIDAPSVMIAWRTLLDHGTRFATPLTGDHPGELAPTLYATVITDDGAHPVTPDDLTRLLAHGADLRAQLHETPSATRTRGLVLDITVAGGTLTVQW